MRKGHSRKYYFLVTSICISIYNTYLIVKIRLKIDPEINWLMETPLHGHKGGDLSGLGAPEEKNYLETYGFSCYWRPRRSEKGPLSYTPFVYLLLTNMVPLLHTRSLTVGGRDSLIQYIIYW